MRPGAAFIIATLAMSAGSVASQDRAPVPYPDASRECETVLRPFLVKALEASYSEEYASIAADGAAVEAACAEEPYRSAVILFRGEAALSLGNPAEARQHLERMGPDMFWPEGREVYLNALRQLADGPALRAERDRLVGLGERAITQGDFAAFDRVEVIETPAATIYSYRGQGEGAVRRFEFIAVPKEDLLPARIWVRYELPEDQIGSPASWDYVDEATGERARAVLFTCNLDVRFRLPGPISAEDRYAFFRARAIEVFSQPEHFRGPSERALSGVGMAIDTVSRWPSPNRCPVSQVMSDLTFVGASLVK